MYTSTSLYFFFVSFFVEMNISTETFRYTHVRKQCSILSDILLIILVIGAILIAFLYNTRIYDNELYNNYRISEMNK